ncbi:NAD(P)H-dependent oxidoreductase [Rhodococcus sp. MEB041]|uniref:flavodoxin family protein n=1 Tax=Rhodococcus sp. MEB041 TaxID=3040323 RepID=UPI002550B242|nr:NAD(P)H-dependent oxidoreductase [Rhodococcus sp. MEB041]
MTVLLVVHHTVSPPMAEMLEAVLAGARDPDIEGVDVRVRPALSATIADVVDADGILLGTPANFGYMSGALKHFLDTVYYPTLGSMNGKPWGAWVYGNNDTAGAVRALTSIVSGWGLEPAAVPVEVTGFDAAARERLVELGGTVAATIMPA